MSYKTANQYIHIRGHQVWLPTVVKSYAPLTFRLCVLNKLQHFVNLFSNIVPSLEWWW